MRCINLGALKSKGFGRCYLKFEKTIVPKTVLIGKLKVRLYEEVLKEFGITKIITPRVGYLFKPDKNDWTKGRWVKSIFEGTIVGSSPEIFVDEIAIREV